MKKRQKLKILKKYLNWYYWKDVWPSLYKDKFHLYLFLNKFKYWRKSVHYVWFNEFLKENKKNRYALLNLNKRN